MSWSDLDESKQSKEAKEKQAKERLAQDIEIAKKFNRMFTSDEGAIVYQYLFNRFVLENETDLNSKNIEYEAGYHAGEAGVVKFITHQMSKAMRS